MQSPPLLLDWTGQRSRYSLILLAGAGGMMQFRWYLESTIDMAALCWRVRSFLRYFVIPAAAKHTA
jgi:hypothetical protein